MSKVIVCQQSTNPKTFRVEFIGREKNALGVRYDINRMVQADDEKMAALALYEEYEQITVKTCIPVEFGFQIRTEKNGSESWEWVHPTGGAPYRYQTEQQARRMMDMCYPMQIDGVEKRVRIF